MTPKAQQIGAYELPQHPDQTLIDNKKQQVKQHQHGAPNNLPTSVSQLMLSNISSKVGSVFNPSVVFLIATPIAVRYPMIQLLLFFTILIGTSPLYFIMITFMGKSNKCLSIRSSVQTCDSTSNQSHRRQPSTVSPIADLSNENNNNNNNNNTHNQKLVD